MKEEEIVMANKVAGDQYETLTGQLFEIGRQLRQANGYPFDPVILKDHLQAAIEGRFFQPSGFFFFDKRKDGWTLLENISRRLASGIVAVSFLKEKEPSINGEEMVRRAQIGLDANFGQEDAEWLLEHQDKIPVELRKYYLIFPGTIWRDAYGSRYVPYLYWHGDRWVLNFFQLDYDWHSDDRLVRPCK